MVGIVKDDFLVALQSFFIVLEETVGYLAVTKKCCLIVWFDVESIANRY
jgi:hypothetical protein